MAKSKIFIVWIVALAVMVGAWSNAVANDGFAGKTIRFIVGSAPGGGYDTYTRAIARHIGKHLPGNPTPVVQNMTGAGTLIAAHYVFNKADPDGLTVGAWNSGQIFRQALGDRAVKFKGDQFGWVGAPVRGMPSCAIMGHTGLNSLKEVVSSGKKIKIGSTRAGTTTDDLPRLLNATLGTNFDVIPGFTGTSRIRIAMQKREIDGVCFSWESARVTATSMIRAKGDDRLIPIVIHGRSEDKEVKDLPQLTEVVSGKHRETMKAWVSQYDFQRPFSLPPNTPKEVIGAWRKGYKATLADPQFLSEAKNSKLIIEHVSGDEIDGIVGSILNMPQDVKADLSRLLGPKQKGR